MSVTSHAVLRHIYTGPALDRINERFVGTVAGTIKITQAEWQTGVTNEGAFTATLSGYLVEMCDDMSRSVLDYIPTWNWPKRPASDA